MKKLVTGTEVRKEEHPVDVEYKGKLSDEVFQKCTEFSTFYFFLPQGFDNLTEKRSALKDKAKELKLLIESSDQDQKTFLSYLEALILRSDQDEFLVPYYMCNESLDSINRDIVVRHDNCYLGLLGTVDKILET